MLINNEDFDASKNKEVLLMSHVSQKGMQMGSLVSLVVALPVLGVRGRLSAENVLRWTSSGILIGTVASTALGLFKMSKLEPEGIEDRAYRLHFNEGQNRVDSFAHVGALVGAGVTLAAKQLHVGPSTLSSSSTWRAALGGAAVGVGLAVLTHIATSKGSKRPNAMIEELKS
uniref:Uncharacterized protein n=1 Tax=Compsopogon caeruleus TaxID=31354 RepID=A0A6T6AS72_9RHOD|mmetsp:Transcript_12167/g.24823  ORF Transcript_12167/g.24823 Transcript_12167/m.24823 type:complete len:172 (+) Transcript_12167:108-623(+)|eukprot:CAMPEP_0184682252 /NCGR_PEP_ID=MMETSP0312-20130426/6517_1 /TAXON_ID=31354 /ORGANISM="Compsopogon coeruleus, Strain SAG 36.94" /LENGTH=171 /DNA_ID=CAMNT_0027133799 /DNA_START=44 /DNA_END=559 /DNA_ORIENTATION=-